MAKYSRSDPSSIPLTRRTVTVGFAVLTGLVLGFFAMGMYMGYQWGLDAGSAPTSPPTPSTETNAPHAPSREEGSARMGGQSGYGQEEAVPAPEPDGSPASRYTVQVASSTREPSARRVAQHLQDAGYPASVHRTTIDDSTYFRVRVGRFSSRREAMDYAETMRENGDVDDYWISPTGDDSPP